MKLSVPFTNPDSLEDQLARATRLVAVLAIVTEHQRDLNAPNKRSRDDDRMSEYLQDGKEIILQETMNALERAERALVGKG